MFEQENTPAPETAQTDLEQHQADEASGRPSERGEESPADRLNEKQETSFSGKDYDGLKLPEAMKGHEETFASFKELAARLNLPPETAKKLVEWEAGVADSGRKTAETLRAQILDGWTARTKEMFGPGYQREIARALDAADRFGGPELRALLDETGLGSHPVVVKTFHEISKQTSEDVSVGGRVRGGADKTFAEALYGKKA